MPVGTVDHDGGPGPLVADDRRECCGALPGGEPDPGQLRGAAVRVVGVGFGEHGVQLRCTVRQFGGGRGSRQIGVAPQAPEPDLPYGCAVGVADLPQAHLDGVLDRAGAGDAATVRLLGRAVPGPVPLDSASGPGVVAGLTAQQSVHVVVAPSAVQGADVPTRHPTVLPPEDATPVVAPVGAVEGPLALEGAVGPPAPGFERLLTFLATPPHEQPRDVPQARQMARRGCHAFGARRHGLARAVLDLDPGSVEMTGADQVAVGVHALVDTYRLHRVPPRATRAVSRPRRLRLRVLGRWKRRTPSTRPSVYRPSCDNSPPGWS